MIIFINVLLCKSFNAAYAALFTGTSSVDDDVYSYEDVVSLITIFIIKLYMYKKYR